MKTLPEYITSQLNSHKVHGLLAVSRSRHRITKFLTQNIRAESVALVSKAILREMGDKRR